jgi:endonuclease/exonuclease/phosphatase family metal-dependent hydrolase
MLFLGSCDMEQAGPLEPGSQVLKNAARGEETPGQLRIMTQNVYVGTDVDQILAAPQEEVPFVVAELFQLLQATNFPERADALAKEIKRAQPHLIGLQEVSTVRFQEEGDFIYNPEVNADLVLYDYLALLMQALQEQNLHYQVAAVVQNFDVEVPMFTGVGEQGLLFSDVRLTDFDVILASDEVICSNVSAANYYYAIDLPGLYIPRGYVAVDAEISGQVYRFVNTHLEDPSSDPVTLTPLQMAQVMELTAVLSDEDDPLIVVGDFNSQAPDGPAYNHMLAEGYQDTWLFNRKVSEEPGYTFGHAPDLQNPTAEFFERIDFVFLKDGDHTITGPVVASVIGDKQRDRTVNGLWPSDHGGLVVMFPLSPLYNQAIQ